MLVDMRKPHMTPSTMPLHALTHFANAADVDTVIVDGRIVMRGRAVATMDPEAVMQEATQAAEQAISDAGLGDLRAEPSGLWAKRTKSGREAQGMKLLVVNPNTTASMTAKIGRAAEAVARAGTQIIATQPRSGPASIQGFHDVANSLHGLLEVAERHPDVDAVVVACFDDTGVDALRCMFDGPVIGIGEAAFHAASMVSCRFSVVTTLSRSLPGLRDNLERYGLSRRCASIRATDVPVLQLESDGAGGRGADRGRDRRCGGAGWRGCDRAGLCGHG